MLRVHTVAAGGGSLCRFDGFRLTVGPESAGADPGPLCYGRPGGARARAHRREPRARPRPARSLPVPARARAGRARARGAAGARCAREGFERSLDEIAAGFVAVANASMAEAISQVSIARGVDPRGCALVGFGGAGGQHVCALARALGMRDDRCCTRSPACCRPGASAAARALLGRPARRRSRARCRATARRCRRKSVRAAWTSSQREGARALRARGVADAAALRIERSLDLRYAGTETRARRSREPRRRRASWRPSSASTRRASATCAAGARSRSSAARVRVAARDTRAARAGHGARRAAAPLPAPLRRERGLVPGARSRRERRSTRARSSAPGARSPGPRSCSRRPARWCSIRASALRVEADGVLRARGRGGPRSLAAQDAAQREARIPCASRCSATASCRSPSRWAPCSATPRSRPTSRSASTTRARSSTRRRARRERAAHPRAPRRDGRDGARRCAALPGSRARRRRRDQRSVRRRLAPARRHRGDARLRGRRARRASSSRAAVTTPTSAASRPARCRRTRARSRRRAC